MTYLDKIASEGKGAAAAEWKRRVADILRADALRHNAEPCPLWDFAYPNSITQEALPPIDDRAHQMTWFWDSNHYKEATGDLVLRKILGLPGKEAHPDFGRRLN